MIDTIPATGPVADLLRVGSYVLTFVAGVLSKVLADGWTDRRRRKHERSVGDERWARVEAAMPALIQEIRADLAANELVREFVPLPHSGVSFTHGATKRFEYFESDHQDLAGKLAMLENLKYITDVRIRPRDPIYRMSEEFIELIQRG